MTLLHLPGEAFVEYQLQACSLRSSGFVAVAAYSDNGLWYVPTENEYPLGGYECGVAWAADRDLATGEKVAATTVNAEYTRALRTLLLVPVEQEARL